MNNTKVNMIACFLVGFVFCGVLFRFGAGEIPAFEAEAHAMVMPPPYVRTYPVYKFVKRTDALPDNPRVAGYIMERGGEIEFVQATNVSLFRSASGVTNMVYFVRMEGCFFNLAPSEAK